jgi:hypothetical protein
LPPERQLERIELPVGDQVIAAGGEEQLAVRGLPSFDRRLLVGMPARGRLAIEEHLPTGAALVFREGVRRGGGKRVVALG